MFTSKKTGGFYDHLIHADMPSDVVEITREDYVRLLDEQNAGRKIVWGDDGFPYTTDAPPLSPEQVTAFLVSAVQVHMDEQARALRYDDIKTAITYADEPSVPKFQAEGMAMREWRSLCLAHCYGVIDAVIAGERETPTAPELIASLPPLVLPV